MSWIVEYLWLIPAFPLAAAAVLSVTPRVQRKWAAPLAVGGMVLSFFVACGALGEAIAAGGVRATHNFAWFEFGESSLRLGWILDPLTAVMAVMVTFVGALIFIFSMGYMAHDKNYTRFFCFLSLFAAAMLGLVVANNLLLLFMCWELVGLASYLLIGFWHHKPSAAAAAKKAFITTRIGDVFFLLGMVWLYAETGTLLFYDDGNGCLEQSALTALVGKVVGGGMLAATAVSLLIFAGAMGKSGQVPLHVWLPDAMEGPTPVSALIHAATMVAAGVFLVARVYPLMAAVPVEAGSAPVVQAVHEIQASSAIGEAHGADEPLSHSAEAPAVSAALKVVTWVGAFTALFAALIAVAQTDIKRILAYSTVSQLGYMFLGLGTGGVAVGMFHLITHAFFKALLFLGAGSVIHGCHDEQDIRRMGGLRRFMPTTFLTYAVGMMALSGVPLLFSGFWSKDEILHTASLWSVSKLPFWMGVAGALLTAFYMTRQVCYVFFGHYRGGHHPESVSAGHGEGQPHESPSVMTVPLIILAVGTVLLSVVGTPVWPWFHGFLAGHASHGLQPVSAGVLVVLLFSSLVALGGIGLGWWLYGRKPADKADQPDILEKLQPDIFTLLREKFYVDELYEMSVIRWNATWARWSNWFDRYVWGGAVQAVAFLAFGVAWLNRFIDEFLINMGFDRGCDSLRRSGRRLAWFQNGQAQRYLRVLALSLVVFALIFLWGCGR